MAPSRNSDELDCGPMSSSTHDMEPAAATVGLPADGPFADFDASDVELQVLQGDQGKSDDLAQTMPSEEHSSLSRTVVLSVALYAVCSSTLLVINKVAMHLLQDASFLLFSQFLASALAIRFLKLMRPELDIELLCWAKVKPFALATLAFYICLLSNVKALGSVNVETVIVVRACSPIAVALVEHLSLGTTLPDWRGGAALLSISGGAGVYVAVDAGFQINGYAWLVVYFVSIVIEMVFVKFIVETVPMSTWTRVYYNNVLSLPLAVGSAIVTGDHRWMEVTWSPEVMAAVALACVGGVVMSYAGFNLRKLVSATSFTIVGVVCKLLTVLINDLIWTNHSNFVGHCGLFLCIAAGFLYEKFRMEQKRALSSSSGPGKE